MVSDSNHQVLLTHKENYTIYVPLPKGDKRSYGTVLPLNNKTPKLSITFPQNLDTASNGWRLLRLFLAVPP